MNLEQWAMILTPLMVGWGSWLTWLVSVRNSRQKDLQVLLDEHTNEIDRLRRHLTERDRLATDTWRELQALRRRVLDLETQVRRIYDQAMTLFAQLLSLGEEPAVTPILHDEPIPAPEKELGK